MKGLRVFTIAFNPRYVDYFARALAPSLMWPRNRAALDGAVWDIWTTEADRPALEPVAKRVGLPVEWHYGMHFRGKKDHSLVAALIGEMRLCVERDAGMLFVAPDIVVGDGTIAAVRALADVPGRSPAFLPLRVRESFLSEMEGGPFTNPQLVGRAMRHAHPGFLNADADLEQTNSELSGVSWRRIGDGLYAVTTCVPSAYLLQPTARDVKWFTDRPKFGNYDHAFGGALLNDGRQRIVGSSDAAFVAEVTPDDEGVAPLRPIDRRDPDRYFQTLTHYQVNRNTTIIWRAEA